MKRGSTYTSNLIDSTSEDTPNTQTSCAGCKNFLLAIFHIEDLFHSPSYPFRHLRALMLHCGCSPIGKMKSSEQLQLLTIVRWRHAEMQFGRRYWSPGSVSNPSSVVSSYTSEERTEINVRWVSVCVV